MSQSWDDLGVRSDAQARDRVQAAVVLMHEASGRRTDAKRIDFYVERLISLAHGDHHLLDALSEAADECECQSVAKLRDEVYRRRRQNAKPQAEYMPTEDERQRSRASALKTALWLHYEHGWGWERFGAEMMGVMLKSAAIDTSAAFEAAKRKHSREQIAVWMGEQK